MRRLSLTLALLFTAGWNPTMAETVLNLTVVLAVLGVSAIVRPLL